QPAAPQAPGLRSAEQTEPLRWPPLREVAASLRFENRRLEIAVPSAEILNTQVDAGHLRMPDLWNPTYLEIDARGTGPLADGRHVLATTPLANQLGGLARAIDVSGNGDIALQLGVPLNKALPFRYSGELLWEPTSAPNTERTLRLKGTDLQFSGIEGRLRFDDETGIDADEIRANLGRQALEIEVETHGGGSDEARTEIGLHGQTPVARLAEALPSTLWPFANGEFDWHLGLSLRNRDAVQQTPPIDFKLSSKLQGLALSVPAPIGKSASEPRAFRLSGRYQDQWPLPLRVDYAELGALIEIDRAPDGTLAPQRLAIDLSGQPAALPPARSIEIGGALESLDLDPWLDWAAGTDLTALRDGDADDQLQLLPVRLDIDDLRFNALRLNDLEAVLRPQADGRWEIQFNAEQSGHGEIRLPASESQNPLRIRLERLDLRPLVEARGAETEARTADTRADPRTFGRLDLEVEQLHYGDDLLGRLSIQSEPRADGVRFETLSLKGPHVDAGAQAEWLIDATDYVETSLELDANSSAIGELLRESGFYSALSGAAGHVQLDLSWPGGPGDLSLARARGRLDLEVGSGRMLDMEPGVGRMLGILNTGALSRRLSLDFSDLFEDGFTFDRIQGEITIGSGKARIRTLSILAPPADIEISGRTDLVEGVLDQAVVVTPEIGVGLALAGTLAGGPVVGAAVFLADQVTDGAVERLGRYAYRVTGPWRDPLIRRVDTGGSPSVGNLFVGDADETEEKVERKPSAGTTNAAPATREKTSSPFLEDF
ncbi:YhdP family protein, partial [Halochromatium salexigens]